MSKAMSCGASSFRPSMKSGGCRNPDRAGSGSGAGRRAGSCACAVRSSSGSMALPFSSGKRRDHAGKPLVGLGEALRPRPLRQVLRKVDIDFDEDELLDLDRRRRLGQVAGQHLPAKRWRVLGPGIAEPLWVAKCTWLSTIAKSGIPILLTAYMRRHSHPSISGQSLLRKKAAVYR